MNADVSDIFFVDFLCAYCYWCVCEKTAASDWDFGDDPDDDRPHHALGACPPSGGKLGYGMYYPNIHHLNNLAWDQICVSFIQFNVSLLAAALSLLFVRAHSTTKKC